MLASTVSFDWENMRFLNLINIFFYSPSFIRCVTRRLPMRSTVPAFAVIIPSLAQ